MISRAFVAAFFCSVLWLSSAIADKAPPNIVLILSDDQSWTDYSFMGHEHIKTPHLDALAERSAVFTRGYVPTALCRPSLMTLATGLYVHQHKTSGNDPSKLPAAPPKSAAAPKEKGKKGKAKGRPPESEEYKALREKLISNVDKHPTIMRLLGDQGYLSHQSGKWWEGGYARGGFTHGMTRGFPKPGGRHGDDGLKIGREGMKEVTDFIDMSVEKKKPFYVWYAPFLPHTPHNPPQRLLDKYTDKTDSLPVAKYWAMCEWFDETCGELIGHLDKAGVADNTLIVYVCDNGWIQKEDSNGYAPRSKQSANEGGTRQPTMFCWPGVIEPGDRGNQLCSSIDIVPTMLSAGGAKIPDALPGLDLMDILKSGEATPRKNVLGEGFAHDIPNLDKPEDSLLYRWVVQDQWKLLLTYDGEVGRYASSHPRTEKRPQLYNLLEDPHENKNLASENPEVVSRLAKEIADWWPVTERKVLTEWSE